MPMLENSGSNSNLKKDLIAACKMLVHAGLDSGPFGNLSVRIPGTDETWQNPVGIYFPNLTEADLVRVHVDGRVLEGLHAPHPGAFIHRQIYRLRPDVGAVVHTHSKNTVLMSLLAQPIQPFTQLGLAIHGDQGVYAGFNGPVRDSGEGEAIAQALGPRALVIAKNHGIFAAASTIQRAVWDFMIADQASEVHLEALKIGLKNRDLPDEPSSIKSRREIRDGQPEANWQNLLKLIQF